MLFDLGKYLAEFTVDHGEKECKVVGIGADGKTPTVVAAKEFTLTTKETKGKDGKVVVPMTVKLLPKDPNRGKAMTFVGTDPGLGNVTEFERAVLGEVDGKPSQSEFRA